MFSRDRLWIFAVPLLVLAALVLLNPDHTVDDAFIGFRYAQNLIHRQGLVYNPGERVEGYSNFLWVLLMAPFIAGSIDPEAAARALGFIASAGTLAAVARAAVLSAEGLERGSLSQAAGLLLGAAALTRPEGAGVAAVLFALAWILGPRTPEFRRSVRRGIGMFLLILLPYFGWKWWYYGRLLPNTYYAKVGAGPAQVERGLQYIHAFFAYSGSWLLLPLIGLRWAGRRRAALLLGGLALALAACAIFVGGDALPMFRFLVPLLPAFFLLLSLGAAGFLERFGARRYARPALPVVLLLFAVYATRIGFTGAPYDDVARDIQEVSAWKEVGRWLRDHAPRDATVALVPAGAIPYYSKLRAIDMLGLNDATIAHREVSSLGSGLPGHEKFDVDYVLSRRPDIILLGVYGLDPRPRPPEDLIRYSYEAEWRMLDSQRFRDDYRIRLAHAPGGYFPYFARAR